MAETKSEKGDKAEKGAKPGKVEKPAVKGAKADAAAAEAKGAKDAKGKARKEAGTEIAAAGGVKAAPKGYVARLKKLYQDEIVPKLTKEFGYKNLLEVPKLEKIVLNMGVGEAVNDTKKVTSAAADLALIAGQKAVITRARKAISTFRCVRTCRSEPRSRCARPECTNSSIVWSRWRCLACVTSAASIRNRS